MKITKYFEVNRSSCLKRLLITIVAALALLISGAANAAPAPKVDICHWDEGSDSFRVINISAQGNAVVAHFKNHGDSFTGTWYVDADNDGFGDPALDTDQCPQAGLVANGADCNDKDASINPDAEEICGDGIDNNCSGEVDEGCGFDITSEEWGTFVEMPQQILNSLSMKIFLKDMAQVCLDSTTLAVTIRPDLFVFPRVTDITGREIFARTSQALSDPGCFEPEDLPGNAKCFNPVDGAGNTTPISLRDATGISHNNFQKWMTSDGAFSNVTDAPSFSSAKSYQGTLESWYKAVCGYNGANEHGDIVIELPNSEYHWHVNLHRYAQVSALQAFIYTLHVGIESYDFDQ